MARVMVDTYLRAHRGQIPDEAWQKRHDQWTYDVSERGWAKTLSEIAAGTRPDECIFVACDEQDVAIGLAMGGPSDDDAAVGDIGPIYVLPEYQGRGLGRELIRSASAFLFARGMGALHIGVLEANAPARGFYEALGGRVVGRRTFDEYGHDVPGVVYGWPDIGVLL